VQQWAGSFTSMLDRIFLFKKNMAEKELDEHKEAHIFKLIGKASQKLVFLNYDGCLISNYQNPDEAFPNKQIINLINELSEIKGITLVLLSARDHITLNNWFGSLKVDLIAEYGTWLKENNQWVQSQILRDEWKDEIYPLLSEFMNKTPGSFIDEKSYSLAWNYYSSDSFLADLRMPDLINALIYPCTKHKLEIIDGNKIIEIKPVGVDKKTVTRHWLNKRKWDFIMAIGADKTDEDIMEILPKDSISIRVGRRETIANYTLKNPLEVIRFLTNLLQSTKEKKKQKILSLE
jgi:trehalose 6-phosphate synthase/phosphatase